MTQNPLSSTTRNSYPDPSLDQDSEADRLERVEPTPTEPPPLAVASPVLVKPEAIYNSTFQREAQPNSQTASRSTLLSPLYWWRSVSVKNKATAIAVALGVVPVLVVGGIATYFANQVIVQEALEERQRLAVDISLRLSDLVRDQFRDTETLATTLAVKNVPDDEDASEEELIEYFRSYLGREVEYEQISSVTPQGAYLELNRTPLKVTETEVEESRSNSRPFTEINASYFLQTRNTLRPSMLLRPSVITEAPAFYLAVPVKDALEELSYLVYSQTPSEVFSEELRTHLINLAHKGGTATTAELPQFRVVDHAATYFEKTSDGQEQEISPTRLKLEGNTVTVDGNPLRANEAFTVKENQVIISSSEGVGTEIQSIFPQYLELRNEGVTATVIDTSTLNGQDYLLSYTPIAQVEGLPLDWGVLIYEPTAIAFAAQRTLLLTLVLGTLLTALIVGTVAAMLANRATRPLILAAEAVDKIGQGELDTRILTKGKDEIATLGTNINQMASQIQSYLDAQKLEAERERVLATAKGSGALRTPDLALIFDQVLPAARNLLSVDRLILYRVTPGGGAILAEANRADLTDTFDIGISEFDLPEAWLEQCWQGETIAVNDLSEVKTSTSLLQSLEQLAVRSTLVAPIRSGEQLFGVIMAHRCELSHASSHTSPHTWEKTWQEYEISFLTQLAAELSSSVYRVELLEQTEKLAEEQRQLKEGLQTRALSLLQEVDPISKGDLTIRARVTADEIGTIADSYNATVDSLRKIVLQVQSAADEVVTTTSLNESSVQALSQEALRQAEEIALALGLVKDMANAVQLVATNAEQAERAMQQANETVAEGDRVMNRTVEGIQVVRSTIADTAKKVKHLGESSQKISKVVELISAFAAQTNMLALNASIEASRAGEEGRGFAVVASEVRALARQSAEATEDIRKLVASIQTETSEVVMAMESGIEQVVVGTKLVDETRHSLNKISAVSVQISELVAAIAQSTVAQSQTSDTVTQTMRDVAAIADKTSTEVNQVAVSFEQLRQVAQTLQAGIGQFKV